MCCDTTTFGCSSTSSLCLGSEGCGLLQWRKRCATSSSPLHLLFAKIIYRTSHSGKLFACRTKQKHGQQQTHGSRSQSKIRLLTRAKQERSAAHDKQHALPRISVNTESDSSYFVAKLILNLSRIFLASIATLSSSAAPLRRIRFSRSEMSSKSDKARGRVELIAKVTTMNSGVCHSHSLMSQLKL